MMVPRFLSLLSFFIENKAFKNLKILFFITHVYILRIAMNNIIVLKI